MFASIYKDLKNQINFGNNITRLITINVSVFIILYIVFVFITLFAGPNYKAIQDTFINYLTLPSDPIELMKKPWTIITHMFLHRDFFHILWNMLFLYWFGRIFGDLLGDQRVVPLYLLAGLVGALFFLLGANLILPIGGHALGASASVLGLVLATAVVAPDYSIQLILIGPVKLKYIALVIIVLDLVGLANMDNTGGHFAHIGGMVMGWFFISLIHNGNDPSPWFGKMWNKSVHMFEKKEKPQPRSPLSVRHKASVSNSSKSEHNQRGKAPMATTSTQEKLDFILDKISKKGISSLSSEEKEFLDKISKD